MTLEANIAKSHNTYSQMVRSRKVRKSDFAFCLTNWPAVGDLTLVACPSSREVRRYEITNGEVFIVPHVTVRLTGTALIIRPT